MNIFKGTNRHQRSIPREDQSGFILFATLVSVMSLAMLIGLAQIRAASNQRLVAALVSYHRESLEKDAIHDRLRGLLADQMVAETHRNDRPALSGTSFRISHQGQDWSVTVQDVDGLLDVYFTAPAILTRALPDGPQFITKRENALQSLPLGSRFPRIEMSLARFGVAKAEWPFFTQSTTSSFIRLDRSPAELKKRLTALSPDLTRSGQTQKVLVRIQKE